VAESEWGEESDSCTNSVVDSDYAFQFLPLSDVTKLVQDHNHDLAESDILSEVSHDQSYDFTPYSFSDRKMPGVLVGN
jgi:hypothetical protein